MFKNQPNCLVLRGSSGSGKSSLAKYIQSLNFNNNTRIVSADYFFTDPQGNYNFNPALLGQAHAQCKEKFFEAMKDGVDILVDNTNTARKDRNFYLNAAKEKGYRVFSVVVESVNNTENVHGVDEETILKQRNKLRDSINI